MNAVKPLTILSTLPSAGLGAVATLMRPRRASAAASAAAISGLRIIVSVTTARTPTASTSAARSRVDRVDHERAADLGVRAGDADARHVDAERRP